MGLTSVTGAANHDDADYPATFLTRGNLTGFTRYSNAAAGTGAITRTISFDNLGNVRTAQVDCCTQKTSNFSANTQYAYPDSIVTGPAGGQFSEAFTYNLDNGLVFSHSDPNGQVTSYQYDSMGRPTVTTPPSSGAVITLAYGDNVVSPTITQSNSGNSLQIVKTMDGLGELLEVDNNNGASLVSKTTYAYDGAGQRTQASNPFGPSETAVNTIFAYDALGRPTQITPQSGGSMQSAYSGNSVTTTDPAGKQRKNFTDALGRLVEVDEPGWGDAVPATGTVNITAETGGTGDQWSCTTILNGRCLGKFWDTGSVTLTVNGVPKSVNYGSTDTTTSIATNLAAAFHNDGTAPVDATSSGTVITLTARTAGVVGNSYAMSGSTTTNDPNDFYPGSFFANPATSTLNKGLDAAAQSSPTLVRPLVTTYVYDVLDNLVSSAEAAMQLFNGAPVPGQARSYVYDSMGRLTQSTTPESGTTNSFYTKSDGVTPCSGNPSLVCYTVDARNVTKTLTYADPNTGVIDPLNRLRGISYTGGIATPSVSYTYDTGGAAAFALERLTQVTEGANSQTFTYDNLGRTLQMDNLIDGTHYLMQYGFNAAGQISTLTYPSGRVVTQNYDAIGRLNSILSGGTQHLTVNSSDYSAAGFIKALTLGNGVQGAFGYNDHMQIASLRYFKTGNPQDLLNLSYDYGTGNNGQIQAIHYYTVPGTEDTTKSEYFTYDPWSRLSAAHTGRVDTTPGTWSLQWSYDRLGNRLTQLLVGGNVTIGQPQLTVDPNTNRISGFTYDSAGNMTGDGVNTYTFDDANRLTQVNGGSAAYTFVGASRVKKVNGGTATIYIYSGDRPIAEYAAGSPVNSPSKEYVYNSSQLLATIAGTAVTYHHPDHRSNRAESDAGGNWPPVRTYGHFPFGETWYQTGTADKWAFTSYERDTLAGETGLDYARARMYSSGLARFTAVDPLGGNPGNPQSLNRYTYAVNDPINASDPTGLVSQLDLCMLNDLGDVTNQCASFSNGSPDGSDPLAEGEAFYDLQVSIAFLMNALHVDAIGIVTDSSTDQSLVDALGRLSEGQIPLDQFMVSGGGAAGGVPGASYFLQPQFPPVADCLAQAGEAGVAAKKEFDSHRERRFLFAVGRGAAQGFAAAWYFEKVSWTIPFVGPFFVGESLPETMLGGTLIGAGKGAVGNLIVDPLRSAAVAIRATAGAFGGCISAKPTPADR